MNLEEASNVVLEGKLDDFDKAYDVWHTASVNLTKAFSKASTNKNALGNYKKALQSIEDAIDDAKLPLRS